MKIRFTLLVVFFMTMTTGFAQQISNGSFENWTNDWTPVGWVTGEGLLTSAGYSITNSVLTFKDTTTFTQGLTSVEVVSDSVAGVTNGGIVGAPVSLGTGFLNPQTGQTTFTGVGFSYRPDTLIFDYKLSSPGIDTAVAEMHLSNGFTTQVLGLTHLLQLAPSWTHVAIPLDSLYESPLNPDTLEIQFVSSYKDGHVKGTSLHVDGVRFGYKKITPMLNAYATVGGPTSFCQGDSVLLTANTSISYTYNWIVDGNPITGATNSTYEAKGSGSYAVIIDSAAVKDTSNTVVVKDSNCTTGVNLIVSTGISVYPNPATTLLSISSNTDLSGFNLAIFDVPGRLLIRRILDGNLNSINVSKLENGTYIYLVTDKENHFVFKDKLTVVK